MALVTTQSKPFLQLVDLQQQSLDALNKIKDSVGVSAEQRTADTQAMQLEQLRKILDVQQDSFKLQRKASDIQAKSLSATQESMKKWKTWGDKARDMKQGVSDTFNPLTLKKNLLSALNIGGMFNQKIKATEYVQKRKELGDTRSAKDLAKDGKAYAANQRKVMVAQQGIDRLKSFGASEDDIANSPKGKALLAKRNSGLGAMGRLDGNSDATNKMGGNPAYKSAKLPKTPSDKGMVAQSTTDALAEDQSKKENQNEAIRLSGMQTDLLSQIATNTAIMAGKSSSSAGGKEDSGGGGMMAGIAVGMKALGGGFASLGKGMGKGLSGLLTGLAEGLMALVLPATLLIPAVLAIGTALRLAAPAFEAITPVVIKLAEVFQTVFLKTLQVLPDVIRSVGDVVMGTISVISDSIINIVNTVTDSIDRLSKIDGRNLAQVGVGLLAISGGMVAFAAANVLTGVSNLAAAFFGSVSGGSPIDQFERLANMSDGLMKAADGIDAIATAMQGFAKVDPKSMEAINDFPWLRATAFVAAGGSMAVNGAKVYNQSKSVEDEKAVVDGQRTAASTQNVSTAVQNNNTTNNIVKPNVRNQESSQSRYLASRY